MRSGSTLVTDTIGDLSPRPTMPRLREISEPAAPISWDMASSSASRAPFAFSDSTAMMPWEWPAIATGGVPGRSSPWRLTARIAAIWASRMPGPEIAAVVNCLVVGSGSSAASARTHCIGSKPIGRTTTSSRATGSSSSAASPTISLSSDSMPAELISSSRFSSQLPPWPPNATAYGSPALSRSTSACAPVSEAEPSPATSVLAGGHPVVFVDRHVLPSPRCAAGAYRSSSDGRLWRSLPRSPRGRAIRRRISTGSRHCRVGLRRLSDFEEHGGLSLRGVRRIGQPHKGVIGASTIFGPQNGYWRVLRSSNHKLDNAGLRAPSRLPGQTSCMRVVTLE